MARPAAPPYGLGYAGATHDWQVGIYRAGHDDHQESIFPSGLPSGTCQDALDLYLGDPTARPQVPDEPTTGTTSLPVMEAQSVAEGLFPGPGHEPRLIASKRSR